MKVRSLSYPSADDTSTVRAWLWAPSPDASRPVRAIIQIVHGMSEHAGRYRDFISCLCEHGYAVCANDHVGHGRTAPSEEELGHMPLGTGETVLVRDVHALRMQAIGMLGVATPYVLFGHSMGSFIVRVYLTHYACGVHAAILCGTGQQPLALTWAGRAFCGAVSRFRGERHRSGIAHALGAGGYGRAVKDARTPWDWISSDPRVVDEYLADPLCGRMFTVGAYSALARLVSDATRTRLARRIPRTLPMLFISGAEDPVGDFGRGVHRAAEQYRRAGVEDVEEIVYPHARHEILNEPVRGRVQSDVLGWLERRGL